MVKVSIALILLAHGIGHSLGLIQMLRVATVNPDWRGDSWLISGAVGTTGTQIAGGVLWTAAIVGFAALAASVVGWLPATWFAPLAIGSAGASLLGLLLFPVAFPVVSTIGALVVDLAVLVAVFAYHWLPGDLTA